MTQLALPLTLPDRVADRQFLVSASNQRAVQHLERWGAWPVMASLLVGPRKSGRSTLARLFAEQSGGSVIDDAERHPERALFAAWNAAQATRRPLLIVADSAPPDWRVQLADLRSRLNATPVVALDPPDEALIAALFDRLLLRRGLDARPNLVRWLATRVERSHLAVLRAVDALEQASFMYQRRLSIVFAQSTLAEAGLIVERRLAIDSPSDHAAHPAPKRAAS